MPTLRRTCSPFSCPHCLLRLAAEEEPTAALPERGVTEAASALGLEETAVSMDQAGSEDDRT